MPDETVTVQEVKSAEVTKPNALRMFVGKFIVDFVETLAVSIPVSAIFLPASMEDLQKLAVALIVPVGSALLSAARRNWSIIREWLVPSER